MPPRKTSTTPTESVQADRQFVAALARGLEILRCFTPERRMLGTTEIGRLTGLPQPTVWRLTHTLVKLGYLVFHPASERLSVGPGAMALGYAAAASTGITEFARPLLNDICVRFDVTASIGANHGLSMVIVQRAENMNAVRLSLHVGSSLPLGDSTLGAAYLCGLADGPRSEALHLLRSAAPQRWPACKHFIDESLATHARYGYVLNLARSNASVNSIGVPISAPDTSTVMAIACGGPTNMASRAHLTSRVAPVMLELAQQLAPLLDAGLRH
ncbi:MAG: helix-turn-helix domain-containing protein [Burkholderiaceae bacterium]|nr:helix-turn-helix domain-containing protein [Burkholderiaceae bacterium]MDO9089041.1 helix-turn-helix domain-containing protein [Burkholderiaceae bacterium]